MKSKTEAKNIHLTMLSATGRATLPVHSFCPPPVSWIPGVLALKAYLMTFSKKKKKITPSFLMALFIHMFGARRAD